MPNSNCFGLAKLKRTVNNFFRWGRIKQDEDEGTSDSQNPWAKLFSGSSVEVKEIKVSKTKRRSRSVDISSPGRPTGPLAQRDVPQK